MQYQNVKVTILYGSQTGNAQDLAERIWRESKRYFFTGSVSSMDDYDVQQLINETCVVFVCSTTGQGEEPDNMKKFWRFLLRRSLPRGSLASVKYAVLGLGDSSYIKFNFVAKRLQKRLSELGAEPVVPVGLGDEQHDLGYDAVANSWIDDLFSRLSGLYPLPNGIAPLEANRKILPRWNLSKNILLQDADLKKPFAQQSIYYSTRASNEFYVTVKENLRVTTPTHFQDVRLIQLATNGEKYGPGDVVSLRPKNLPHQVEEFQKLLRENSVDIHPDDLFKLSETTPELPVPKALQYKVTFQQLCEEYFDLTAIPRRYIFSVLAQLTDSDLEKEKCLEFTTAEGQEDLYAYCNRPKRNIVEVLQDFPHATKNLTKEMLFEVLTPIKPRDFSVASSYKAHPNEVHILVAVVKYKTKLVKERLGLCSNYLADLRQGDRISVWLKGGSFKFPQDSDAPVIMVGPGTGVAPFRNYIFEQVYNKRANAESMILIFGCRNKDKDFYCKEEFLKLQDDKKLNLICAFSRDQEHKIYVQHKIIEEKEVIWKLLETRRCYIFVAGSSKNMPREVRETFVNVCIDCGKMSEGDAEEFIMDMERKNLYQQETWF